ncbi:MAG: hypothetical protein GC145_12425 [Caulobacter sp.]|nr:hypothetical protein [Caulobacter sp.]
MAQQLEFAGQSGQGYRYLPLDDSAAISPTGANFLFVRVKGGEQSVVFAGETECLHKGVHAGWDKARKTHGATTIFVRLNVTRAIRQAELDDIVALHQPPMNGPED